MEIPFAQALARELEVMSGYESSHVYVLGDFDGVATVKVGVVSLDQPTSVLVRDLQDATALDGATLCYRDAETKAPKLARVLGASASEVGTFLLTLNENVRLIDGDDVTIRWPQ